MNVHDTARIAEVMGQSGYELTQDPGDADVLIVNTCSVRHKAWHKGISEIGRVCNAKKRPDVVVVAAGCVAEQEKEHWFEKMPTLDLVVGPDHYAALPELVAEVQAGRERHILATGFDRGRSEDFLFANPDKKQGPTAFVTVMKGCDERCKYCIVPSVRGPERCRPMDDIVKDVETVTAAGAREITLLGQKVNAYASDGATFADLLARLDRIPGLARLRFTSPHPKHMDPALIDAFGTLPSLCESIHLPVQSGSDHILEKMGRQYTSDFYREITAALRHRCPDMLISTDLIVGYPGETDRDFADTIALLEDVRFSGVFSFKYSPRPGTPAAQLQDDVPELEKQRRLAFVHDIIAKIEREIRATLVGRRYDVLVEGRGRNPGQFSGRLRNNQIVNFLMPSDVKLTEVGGELMEVEIIRAMPHCLEGSLV